MGQPVESFKTRDLDRRYRTKGLFREDQMKIIDDALNTPGIIEDEKRLWKGRREGRISDDLDICCG